MPIPMMQQPAGGLPCGQCFAQATPHCGKSKAVRYRPVGAVISRSGGRAQHSRTGPQSPSPTPMVTVPPGGHLAVTVPSWGWVMATAVHPARAGVLREQCTVLLPGAGRRTIFLAARHGSTWLGATVQPASNLMTPAWGGKVIVRPAAASHLPGPGRARARTTRTSSSAADLRSGSEPGGRHGVAGDNHFRHPSVRLSRTAVLFTAQIGG
jgi:hypothetical protein